MIILIPPAQFSSVAHLCLTLCNRMDCRLPCPSSTPRAWSNSCPSSPWCHPTISSSVIPFSSCFQSFPASGSFPVSHFFTSDSQSIGASASASILPMNTQDWFPLGLTGLISLQSKGLSRVFSNTTFQKYQFFGTQLSLWSNSHTHTWLLEKPQPWLYRPLLSLIGNYDPQFATVSLYFLMNTGDRYGAFMKIYIHKLGGPN